MIIQVQFRHPEECRRQLNLPDYDLKQKQGSNGQSPLEGLDLHEWVLEHGKEQLLGLLQFTEIPLRNGAKIQRTRADAQQDSREEMGDSKSDEKKEPLERSLSILDMDKSYEENETDSHGEETKSSKVLKSEHDAGMSAKASQLRHRLDLAEKLQKVHEEFLDQVQKSQAERNDVPAEIQKENSPKGQQSSPVSHIDKAFNNLLDSVATWSSCDYGLIARVEKSENKSATINHQREKSDDGKGEKEAMENTNMDPPFTLSKCASLNVPTYSFTQKNKQDGEEEDSSSFTDESSVDTDSSDSSTSAHNYDDLRSPRRSSQPITTYGPVHYKTIPGSVTLMMDQLRFEPANPRDNVHEVDSDSDDDDDDCEDAARKEYNYVEVHWDRVVKYQLTPKTSSKYLFKLLYNLHNPREGLKRTKEVVLKMSSRAELERITQDVKARVVLPSRRKRTTVAKKKKAKTKSTNPRPPPPPQLGETPLDSPHLTRKERSVMLPPSLPKRMISGRHLLVDDCIPRGNLSSLVNPPLPPQRRMTLDNANDISFVSVATEDDNDSSSSSSEEEQDSGLWAVNDILEILSKTRAPLLLGHGRRCKPRKDSEDDNNNGKIESIPHQLLLLPPVWELLVALPCFSNDADIHAIFVIAITNSSDDANDNENFATQDAIKWWAPLVTTLMKDFLQQKNSLDNLARKSKAAEELETKLRESLRRHSEMIHGILPPSAISKLKIRPQQWKDPLQHQPTPPLAQVNPLEFGSVHDSSISGSVNSRVGIFLNGLPPMDSESTFDLYGTNTDSDYYLYSVSEDIDKQYDNRNKIELTTTTSGPMGTQPFRRTLSARSNNVNTMGAALRVHRQSSVTNRNSGRPIFSCMDSGKRDMLMMPRAGSAVRGNGLVKVDSARFGSRGVPRLNSLKQLHSNNINMNMSIDTSSESRSIDTLDESWQTMYTNDESISSIHPEDLPKTRASSVTSGSNVPGSGISHLTGETTVQYINSSKGATVSNVQALYAARQSNVSILCLSVTNFPGLDSQVDPTQSMNLLAKAFFVLDVLCAKYGIIKVETIGNTVLAVSGLFNEEDDDWDSSSREKKAAVRALEFAKEAVAAVQSIRLLEHSEVGSSAGSSIKSNNKKKYGDNLRMRAGVHLGELSYGVIGQNVPKLTCFGDSLVVAVRMEQTAEENCIRASKMFHDFVGSREKNWDREVSLVNIIRKRSEDADTTVSTELISSSSSSLDANSPNSSFKTIEAYTLEPPPTATWDGFSHSCSSTTSSFPSLAPWNSSEFLHNETGNMLAEMEESFVSGEFYVD